MADRAAGDVVGNKQPALLRDVHRVGVVLEAPRLAVHIPDDPAHSDRLTFFDMQALRDGERGGDDPHLEGLAWLLSLLTDLREVGVALLGGRSVDRLCSGGVVGERRAVAHEGSSTGRGS